MRLAIFHSITKQDCIGSNATLALFGGPMNPKEFEDRYQRVKDEIIIVKDRKKNKLGLIEFTAGQIDNPGHDHTVIMTNRQPTQLICDCKDAEFRSPACKHVIATAGAIAQDAFASQVVHWSAFFFGEDAKWELEERLHNGQNAMCWHWLLNGFWVVAWEAADPKDTDKSADVLVRELWGERW